MSAKKEPKAKIGGKHLFPKGKSANPAGRQKGIPNKMTIDMKRITEEALRLAGEAVQRKRRTLKDMEAGTAYLTDIAEKRPELFMPLVRQLLPAKIDVDVSIMNRDMVGLLSDRRDQMVALRNITPPTEDTDADQ